MLRLRTATPPYC